MRRRGGGWGRLLLAAARDFSFCGVIFVFPEIFAVKPSDNLRASALQAASCRALGAKNTAVLQKDYRSRAVPKQSSAYRAWATSQRSKMYVTAVQIAEFLIMVIIIMSLPKLVTS